jgi:hypothetical protein
MGVTRARCPIIATEQNSKPRTAVVHVTRTMRKFAYRSRPTLTAPAGRETVLRMSAVRLESLDPIFTALIGTVMDGPAKIKVYVSCFVMFIEWYRDRIANQTKRLYLIGIVQQS